MRYRYSGPVASLTLKGKEVRLTPGAEVELPEELRYVRGLVARGHLAPVQPAQAEEKAPRTRRTARPTTQQQPAAAPAAGDDGKGPTS